MVLSVCIPEILGPGLSTELGINRVLIILKKKGDTKGIGPFGSFPLRNLETKLHNFSNTLDVDVPVWNSDIVYLIK